MKRTILFPLSRESVIIILVIIAVAAILSLASILSYNYTTANLTNSAIRSIHETAQTEASDMSNLVAAKMKLVATNLKFLSSSEAILTQNAKAAQPLFDIAQNSTSSFTYAYYWVDKTGRIIDSSNLTVLREAQKEGVNVSQSPFFIGARESGTTYFSTSFVSQVAGRQMISIAQPIYAERIVNGQTTKVFDGIVSASIVLTSIGALIQNQLSFPKGYNVNVGMIDPTGVILYAENESFIGVNAFGSRFQALVPPSLKEPFDIMLNQSLWGNSSGLKDLSLGGLSTTLAYQPVLVSTGPTNQVSTQQQEFAILFIAVPDVLKATQASQIAFARNVSTITILGIAASSLFASMIVVRWNKRLDEAIKEKTAELTSANLQLEEQARAQKDLINIAAHELRTPTQSILFGAEMMHDAMQGKSTLGGATSSSSQALASSTHQREAEVVAHENGSSNNNEFDPRKYTGILESDFRALVDSTYANAKRLGKLTKNILEVARIDNRTLKLELENLDLNETIRDAIEDSLNASLQESGRGHSDLPEIVFEPENPSSNVLAVYADKTKVYEVLSNLLRNAIHHSPKGSRIRVSTKSDSKFVLTTIKDQGEGIDPQIYPRLFGKFVTKSGTGLGLYISKGYIEALGGKICAENNPNGNGASFYFTLPRGNDNISEWR